ncbi:MAG: hypothetical protein WAP35_04070, partial [Solirubrobacterales bacterium]
MHRSLTVRPVSRVATCLVTVVAVCLVLASQAFAATPYDRVLTVGFEPAASAADRRDARADAGVT